MGRTALITGVTGQDGFYLAELLLAKGYTVHGLVRSHASGVARLGELSERISLLEGDLTDQASLDTAVKSVQPDEVYNLAAQSFVAMSWTQPVATGDITALGAVRVLEAVRRCCPDAKVFQASSAEVFGNAPEMPQSEKTPFCPRNPYGTAKAYAYRMTVNHRESYGMFCCNGILFNHESPRRGIEFVTRKITNGAARIACGLDKELRLGNLDAYRDWGFAGDYVKAMWLILQQETPDDYVIATGEAHSVREFVDLAFSEAGLNYEDYVVVDPKFFRPAEVNFLLGDASKAQEKLGWKPDFTFADLVRMMVRADLESVRNGTIGD
ncbi:GDP-D-mannose dehydratase [Methanoculleus taiwanensis]|uniref:GDP-mannose 4,6-dehydratase n=1 Tax=Methanoculleus taiwanensis TaxID=1550565 RepID=A0A498H1Z8_9EURY|nr:GDP-mannose 4,6-dehydratase [Methanoculleus taiwanensis]RXE55916.1 GDP-D-mannose dehydratase [Methanoculleus taiwanensis]